LTAFPADLYAVSKGGNQGEHRANSANYQNKNGLKTSIFGVGVRHIVCSYSTLGEIVKILEVLPYFVCFYQNGRRA
jgi:hypothetical protein